MARRWVHTGGILAPPPWTYTGPGSALTYGKRVEQPYGKIFLLAVDYNTQCYKFFKAPAYFEWTGQTIFLDWEELPPPPISGVTPRADAAICYLFNPISLEEKVLAVFAGERYLWTYDVPSKQWRQEIAIGGTNLPDKGASMEFGGFLYKDGVPVTTFYLIKGGGSYEFMAYNRPYIPAKGNFSYWEMLEPFGGPDPNKRQPFYKGADLAMYHPDPYQLPAPDTIFAMRGNGKPFGLYRVSQNRWELRDDILGNGAYLGGALVSHPKWGDIRDDDPPDKESPPYDINSILHCFRGENRENIPTDEFDCYDIIAGSEFWNSDSKNPDYTVSSGSDLCFGGIWYKYNGEVYYKDCIWASFGNNQWYIGIHYRNRFPWQNLSEPEGSQSNWTATSLTNVLKVQPNPGNQPVSFQLESKGIGAVLIYNQNGQIVRALNLSQGRTTWDLRDALGKRVSAGVYFYRVKTDGNEIKGKLIIRR